MDGLASSMDDDEILVFSTLPVLVHYHDWIDRTNSVVILLVFFSGFTASRLSQLPDQAPITIATATICLGWTVHGERM
jgi:hypothetical protein